MPRSASKRLVDWYRANKRDLPWRGIDDPYAILVSEVMLQQTQVATVMPYYERFIALFPSVQDLACAREEEAMAVWAGLGYYRRLQYLRAAAQFVCENGWPADLHELPGVGQYTAAALGSIAFGKQVACADGNVRRVMSRLSGRTLSLQGSQIASQEMMGALPGNEWNQAVMELGALVCTRTPNCSECPIKKNCVAYSSGTATELPFTKNVDSVSIEHVCACFIDDERVALRKPLPGEWWVGLLVFPYSPIELGENAIGAAKRLGLKRPQSLGTIRHTVTKHRITLNAFSGSGSPEGVDWHPLSCLKDLPLPAPQRRVVRLLERAA